MVVEEVNTTARDQRKARPDRVWRPGRLGAGGQGPGDDTGEAGRDVAAQGHVEQGAFVGDRQAEDLTGKLVHGPDLDRLTGA